VSTPTKICFGPKIYTHPQYDSVTFLLSKSRPLGVRSWNYWTTSSFPPSDISIYLLKNEWDPNVALERLLALLARSKCSLSVLSLESASRFEPFPVMDPLQAVPTITELYLTSACLDFAIFFTRVATDSAFLPNLQTLHVEEFDTHIPYPEVCAMLVSRWYRGGTNCAQLRSFRLVRGVNGDYDVLVDPAISGKLLALVDEGVKIYIESLHEVKPTEQITNRDISAPNQPL
jgi:hypothetical protein